MKIALLIPLCILASCSNRTSDSQASDSATVVRVDTSSQAVPQKLGSNNSCYQHLFGKQSQDTSFIKIIMDGENVSGVYNYLPYEKDSRKGTFSGTLNNGMITAVWRFMQEGINDSLPLKFKLSQDALHQQNYSFDPKTGRQFLSDTAKFIVAYKKIDCN